MLDPDEALAARMFAAVPGLRAELDDYQRRYVGDWAGPQSDAAQLPGFLVKLALDCRRRGADERGLTQELFDYFESEVGRDDEVDGLIEGFFVAYLPEPADRAGDVLGLLGPELWEVRAQLLVDDQAGVLESVIEFVYRLAEEIPDLRDRVDVQARRGRHTRLADAVLAELAVDAVEMVAVGRALDVLPLLEFLESEYGANPAIDTVIDVSFLELLPDSELVTLLGPKLQAEFKRQREWVPGGGSR
ncbi:hypothetical protein AB0L70_23710 [Kribbella sp. NPDC051952]|uniref:hypothetical protein n=1 Tax=Kribbella sp. NPDC051952 TaxID=3154851 RepID=UPI00343992AD